MKRARIAHDWNFFAPGTSDGAMVRALRLFALLSVSAAATTNALAAPPPVATISPPPGVAPPLKTPDDAVQWGGPDQAGVLVVTDTVKAELEARPNAKTLRIVVRRDATDAQLAVIVKKLPWIETLVFDENQKLTTLAPLTKLTRLRSVHVNGNRIPSLAGLANHPSLEGITMTCSPSFTDKDLAALSNIRTLTSLELRDCRTIVELTGLEKLPALASFSAWDTPFTKVDPIATPKLRMLAARHARIVDLSPLARSPDLAMLDVSGAPATDFTVLRSLTKLAGLNVSETAFADLGVIGSRELWSLDAHGAKQLRSLGSLPLLPKLSMLSLDQTAITDVARLAAFPALTYVSLDGTAVSSVAPLFAVKSLKNATVPTQTPDAEVLVLQTAGVSVLRFGKPLPGVVPGPPIP